MMKLWFLKEMGTTWLFWTLCNFSAGCFGFQGAPVP